MEQPSSITKQTLSPSQSSPADEINLLEYIYVLIKHKKLIASLTLAALVLGYVAALIKGPTWVAETEIAPKERESQKSTSLADLGALGGLVASQLNIEGNASLNLMDMILDSRDFGARLIDRCSLLPVIYKYQWPKAYKKYWDQSHNAWKDGFVQPKLLAMGGFIKSKYLQKTKDAKKNTLVLKIQSKDSSFTINLATMYVDYLSDYIKTKVQTEAKENVAYLDTQLVGIVDPLLRGKVLGLIANEIEKEMVVSREAFKVIDPVYLHARFKEILLFPFVFGLGMFLITCFITVFIHSFSSAGKTKEDAFFIEQIKKELFLVNARKK